MKKDVFRTCGTGVFLWILWNFQEHLFYRTRPDDCFYYLELLPCQIKFESIEFSVMNSLWLGVAISYYLWLFTISYRFSGPVLIICPISRNVSKLDHYKNRVPKEKRCCGCTDLNSFDNTQILSRLPRLVFAGWRY